MKRLFLAGMCTVAIAGAQTLHRLDSLSPAAATAGRGALTLTLTGRFLANNETVSMTCPIIGPAAGCPPIVRLFNSTSQVVVSVPAAYFAYANLTQPISATVASFSDSSPLVVTRTFTVNPPLVINGPTILPQATEGVPYQFQFGPSSGGTAPVSWSCTSSFTPPPGMTLGPANGTCLLSGTPTQTGTYSLQVSASDSGGGTAIKGVRLTVVPSPVSITTTTVPNGTAGAPYSAHIAATGGTGTHTWTIIGGSLPPGLQLASSTGPSVTLTGTPTASGSYGFVVGVSTPVGTASRAYDMAVSPPPLSIAPPSLPSGQAGVPYAAAITATGGSGTYSWSIVQGSPPPGLQLSPTVGSPINLNGIPSAAGTYDFVLQVTAGRVGVTRDYSITVTPPLVITTLTLPDGTVGSPFSAGITSTGGSGAHSWSIVQGSLPPGLQLSPSTGPSVNLTGVPSATGPYSFVVSVASGRAVTTQSYTVTVTPALTITTLQVPDGVVGSPYNATIDSAGGSGIHSWSISSGSLPPGVQLNPSTGSVVSLTGTPDIAGTYSFVVRVAAGQQAATRPYSVTVSPALSITTPLVPDGIVGSPYNATIESAGGSGIHSWSISSGSLPPGVQLNPSTGSVVSLTGTPDIAGTYSFVVRVAAGQQVATRAYSVTVTPALSITTVLAPDGIVGSPYNATIASAGGSGAHSWSISDGSLPPGVQLNPSTGSVVNLTGTPDTAGTYRFVVRVAASQQVATRAYSVTVASALSITTVLVPDGVVGSPYNATIASAGGSGAHSWSIS
ncbi:MAG: putative Ig domain-containing protein, partial [Bryobacteraceae bacterium]